MIRPVGRRLSETSGRLGHSGDDVWATLVAAAQGDLPRLRALLTDQPDLAQAEWWYTQAIHFAVREGHAEAVQLLLEHGADPTHTGLQGDDLLTTARDRGHQHVAALLTAALQTRYGEAVERHAIHDGAAQGDLATVTRLLDDEPSLVRRRDPEGLTPLHHAVPTGHTALVGVLLDRGAEIDAPAGSAGVYSAAGFRPLELAIWTSSFGGCRNGWATVAYLLSRGAAYTATVAAARGDQARLETLVATAPEAVNAPDCSGRRPLGAAVQFGHLELARWLLARGADPGLHEGRYIPEGCALHFAASGRHHDLVRELLAAGAPPGGGIDSCGNAWYNGDPPIRLQLYLHGYEPPSVDLANVDALMMWAMKDPAGLSAEGFDCGIVSMICSRSGGGEPAYVTEEYKTDLLRLLLSRGVTIPRVVTCCKSYLWQHLERTRLLLEHGLDPNLPDWLGATPLHGLCAPPGGRRPPDPQRVEIAKLFIEFGADLAARDEDYQSTPLGWAARLGDPELLELYLAAGAPVRHPDDPEWATPLAWAQRRGHQGIVARLRAAG